MCESDESDGLMILEVCCGSKSNKEKFSFGRIKDEVVKRHPRRYERYNRF